jgi:hypothetical protein
MFAFTRFYLRVLADLNEIVWRRRRNVILRIAIECVSIFDGHMDNRDAVSEVAGCYL